MSVQSITELMSEGSRELHWNVNSGRSYQRKWRAITNSQDDGPVVVATAFGAKYGDRYSCNYSPAEYDLFAYAVSLDITPEGDAGLTWILTVGYTWYDALNAGGGPNQNPLLMPIEVSWDLRDHETVLDTDVNGNAVLNTAYDPYDPPIVIDDPRLVMTVVRNEATFNLGWVLAYRNAVNSDTFAGFPPLASKVLNISSRSQTHQDCGWYYQTTYQFEFISNQINDAVTTGYRKRIVSQGFRALSALTGNPFHITLKGVPISSPMLLDANGYVLKPSGTPYYQTFQAYPELPFAAFGFDVGAISGQRTGTSYTPTYPTS